MTIRIAHLSDIHFGDEMVEAVDAVPRAVADFDPTLTVITGDLTLGGSSGEFQNAARWLARLPPARMLTPGNHDTPYWNVVSRLIAPFARYRRQIGRVAPATFDSPGLSARSLNSARGVQPRLNWAEGAISLDHLRALNWEGPLASTLRLFACHHPLLDLDGAPVAGGVRNGARAIADLAGAGVELILSGHLHNPVVLPLRGDVVGAWAIGAGTLSRRLRGSPASFTTIIAEEDAFTVAAHGWSGDRFEILQSWRLPRRNGRNQSVG